MRILSGIQPSGKLHIGNYFGMMKPALELQKEGEAFLFIADYHALTTVNDAAALRVMVKDVALDFLAAGLDPDKTAFYRQSDVPEVQELAWLLSVVTPMGLLERCHSYKDKLAKGIAATHSLFAYPVLMAADILSVQSTVVPVGRDQKQHVEVTRDIAVKFNNQFGEVFTIPEPSIRDSVAVVPGIDGQKMSKSYGNAVTLREDGESVAKKIRTMPTDPARVKRTDPGNPDVCPVWQLHLVYSDEAKKDWVRKGCASAGIGCLDCKQPVIDALLAEQAPMRERAQTYLDDPTLVKNIIADGCEKARRLATETMREVREAMGLAGN